MNKKKEFEKIVKYAYDNNEFYQKLYGKLNTNNLELENIPYLLRDCMRQSSKSIVSQGYDVNNLIEDWTNGTTDGDPLRLFKTQNEWIGLDIDLWNRRRNLNFDACKSYCFYYYNGRKFDDKYRLRETSSGKIIQFPMRKEKESDFLDDLLLMKAKSIRWLIAPPSVIIQLCKIVEKYNVDISLDVIELISEYTPEFYKSRMKKCFSAEIYIHYSCHEVWGMAFTNENGNLEVMNNVIIEQKVDSRFLRGYGSNIVTSLKLKSMPFIRYVLNDLIKLNEDGTLNTFGFRTSDKVSFTNDTIHCSFFDNAFLKYSQCTLLPLENYQIIYFIDENKILLNLYGFDEMNCMMIRDYLSQELSERYDSEYLIEYQIVDRFVYDKISGKMRGIINSKDVEWNNLI